MGGIRDTCRLLVWLVSACIKAGLIRQPTPLVVLKREWKKASAGEQKEFRNWISGVGAAPASSAGLIDAQGLLKATAIAQIQKAMAAAGLSHGRLSERLGKSRHDPTLGMVLTRRWTAAPEFLDRIWIYLDSFES
jgi:hypothetical protein